MVNAGRRVLRFTTLKRLDKGHYSLSDGEDQRKTIALPIRSVDPSLFAQLIALPNVHELLMRFRN